MIFNLPNINKFKDFYLKGPIPIKIVSEILNDDGNYIGSYLTLYLTYSMTKELQFKVRQSYFRKMGIKRNKLYRDLEKLKQRGYLSLEKKGKKGAVVTLNPIKFSFKFKPSVKS
jgi:uncharacterized membrane protein